MKSARKSLLGDSIVDWGVPLLAALLLNGILISFVPGLVGPISDRQPGVESIPGFRMVHIKPPVHAVQDKIFPKETDPAPRPVPLEITKAEFTMAQKMVLPLDLKTHLPVAFPNIKALPVADFTLPILKNLITPIPSPSKRLKSFYTPDEIDRPLIPLVRNPPVYPRSAKRKGIQGWVDIVYTISRSGDVTDLQVVDAAPKGVYEKSVLQAVSGWRFSPGTVGGNPVNTRVKQRLRFELNHEKN